MPTLAVQLKIGDYAKWRPVFDKHEALRAKAGFTNTQIYRQAVSANEIGATFPTLLRHAKLSLAKRSEAQCKRLAWWDRRKYTWLVSPFLRRR